MSSVSKLLLHRRLYSMKDLDKAQATVTKAGLFGHGLLVARLVAWASLSPQGCLARARSLFEETAMDDALVCNAMVRAYSVSVFPIMAFWVFNHMQRLGVEFDAFTFSFALRACARALKWSDRDDCSEIKNKGFEIHCRALKLGFRKDKLVDESLLLFYAKCGLLGSARQLFDEMSERSVGSWNVMLSAYDRAGDFWAADLLFRSMPRRNVVSWNTLLSRHVRLGAIRCARKVFDEMPERDSVSWNAMISVHVQAKDCTGALRLFREMELAGAGPTEVTLVSVLGACAETGSLETGREIHGSLKSKRVKIEGYLGNALVDMYAKCGDLDSAREVFDNLKIRPASCWNAMIVGLAVNGRSHQALTLFSDMETRDENPRPNRVTFIGVLTACSHEGLVKEGRRQFDRMVGNYRIAPDEKHYGCLVDLLSRWGFVEEARAVVETVPGPTRPVLWRTLLGACAVHGGDVDLAERCFRKLAELAIPGDADYVLLSNVYAEAGRWDDVERLRDEMVASGVAKISGYSHLEKRNINFGL